MMPTINGKTKVFFGTRKEDNTRIYLTQPKFDCGWYWGFGYLGNSKEHYHLSGYQSKTRLFILEDGNYKHITEKRNIYMYDALLADYDLNPKIKKHLWEFCELALTAYTLKETAETLGRGGSYMTTNPCKDLIINKAEVTRINDVVLPAIFNALNDIYESELK